MVLLAENPSAPPVYDQTEFARGVALYEGRNYREFDAYLDAVPSVLRVPFLRELLKLLETGSKSEVYPLVRRVGQHLKFKGLLTNLPTRYRQAVIFTNLPDLKTRVSMSFFDLDFMAGLEIDYSYLIYDHGGRLICQEEATILAGQTHSFDVAEILRDAGKAAHCGTFYIHTAYEHLASLRMYATWFNACGMTTTHEKGALSNSSDLIIYPTIVADSRRDTVLALSALVDEEVSFSCLLFDHAGEMHPQKVGMRLNPRGAGLVSVSKYFAGAADFLKGRPGTVYLQPEKPGRAMYYYFIHDKELGTWQIQHT